MKKAFEFQTRGKTWIFVDWANVFGWSRCAKWRVDVEKLFKYFDSADRRALFFGEDEHPKSKKFLQICRKIGFEVFAKTVKFIDGKRKCDFDVEISVESAMNLEKFETLILFSGDGDYKFLVEKLMQKGKRVFVVTCNGATGREWYEMQKRKLRPIMVDISWLEKQLKTKPQK